MNFLNKFYFLSSSLINQNLNIFEPPVVEYLSNIDRDLHLKKSLNAIDSIKDMNVLFIGETIIDESINMLNLWENLLKMTISPMLEEKFLPEE